VKSRLIIFFYYGMHQLLYLSTASQWFGESDLRDLLAQTRTYNREHQVTGLLLYGQGHFMQLLEGERSVIVALYARILRDPRHHQVTTLVQQACSERCFPAWAMAFDSLAPPIDWPAGFLPLNDALLSRCVTKAQQMPVAESLSAFTLRILPHQVRDRLR
jgi:hypothetical protein